MNSKPEEEARLSNLPVHRTQLFNEFVRLAKQSQVEALLPAMRDFTARDLLRKFDCIATPNMDQFFIAGVGSPEHLN